MIERFLSLFPAFRDLQNLCQAQARAAEDLEKRYIEIKTERDSIKTDLIFCRQANEEISKEKLHLQDRLDFADSEVEKVWGMFNEALGNERNALRTMVNHATQRVGAGIPFPDAHSLPPEATVKLQAPGPVGRRGRALPSRLAAEATDRFIREEYAHLSRESDTASTVQE